MPTGKRVSKMGLSPKYFISRFLAIFLHTSCLREKQNKEKELKITSPQTFTRNTSS